MPRVEPNAGSKRKKRESGTTRLNEKLGSDELLQQLKALAEELSEAEQSSAKQYGDTAEFLARHYVLKHKDKGVRLYAACCLVDILRIYAPEAPFNQDQMWEVFSLIISQLRGLEHGPNGLNIKKHFYILESIALVRSFTVCLELDFQDLILQLFKLFFSVVKESHSVKVLNLMVEVMSPIIEDSESIPQELLDTVLINLIEPIKSQNPSAYRIASNLVEKTSSSIEPFIQMFFNSVLTLGKTSESDLTDRVYDLILELNRIAPLVLLSVLPQLEFKLKSPDVEDRLAVTRLLSQMFSDQSSELAIQNKSLWQSYLGRYLDINVDVRVECVKNAKHFLILNNELSSEVSEKLRSRSKDPDDKVRQEVVTGTCEAASQNIDCVSDKLFEDICERMRDKKSNVRMEAMICIGKLYKKYTTGATADLSAAKRLSWVPNKLLVWYYQPSIEDQLCVERLLSGCLVPVSLPAEERVKRLLSLYTRLDEHAVGALRMVFKCQANVRSDLAALVQLVGEEKSNDTDKMIMSHIITLARTLPNPFKSQENLKKLPEMLKEEKTRALLSTCVNPNVGCPAVFKAVSEFVVKLGARNPILDTMKAMLDRAAPVLVDAECIRILLTQVKNLIEGLEHDEEEEEDLDESTDSPSNRGTKGLDLLVTLSSVFPSHFQNEESFELLLVFLKHHDPQLVSLALQILSNTVEEMQSTAESLISYYQPVLSNLATKGTPRHAKFAIRSLAKIFKDPINVFERIFSNIVSSLDYDHPMLLTYLTSLAELAVLVPSLFETKQKFIIRDFVVKELLVKDRQTQEEAEEKGDKDWCDDFDVSKETQAKIKGIKVMVRWLEGLQSNHKNSGLPVLRLLHTVLVHAGDLQNNNCVCPHDCSRLRLAAACGMLKIAKELNYEEVVSLEHYQQLALTIQDPCFEVRAKFIKKLHKSLDTLKLPLDYLAIFCLAATESNKDKKTQVRQMIARNINIRKEYLKIHSVAQACSHAILPEYALPCVIHLLAHHPDFDAKSKDSLVEFKEYLWFFMEPIIAANTGNAGLIKKLLENIKQTEDVQCPENATANEAIYALCDLAYGLVLNKATGLVSEEFPLNPLLPKKMFQPSKRATPNNKSYLPKGFMFFAGKKKAAVPEASKPASRASKASTKRRNLNDTKVAVKASRGRQLETKNKNTTFSSPGEDTPESGLGSPAKPSPRKRLRSAASPAKKPPAKSRKTATDSDSQSDSEEEVLPTKASRSRGRQQPGAKATTAKSSTRSPRKEDASHDQQSESDGEESLEKDSNRGKQLSSPKKKVAVKSPRKATTNADSGSDSEEAASKTKTSRDRSKLQASPTKKATKKAFSRGARKTVTTADSASEPEEEVSPKKGAIGRAKQQTSPTKKSTTRSPRKTSEDVEMEVTSSRASSRARRKPETSPTKPPSARSTSRGSAPSQRKNKKDNGMEEVESPVVSPIKRTAERGGGSPAKRLRESATVAATSTPASPLRRGRSAKVSEAISPVRGSVVPTKGKTQAQSPSRGKRVTSKSVNASRSPRIETGKSEGQRLSPRRKTTTASLTKTIRSPFKSGTSELAQKSPIAGRAVRKIQSELDSLPEDEESTSNTTPTSSRSPTKTRPELNGVSDSPGKNRTSPRKSATEASPSKKRKIEEPAKVAKKSKTENKPSPKKTAPPVLNVRRRNTRARR